MFGESLFLFRYLKYRPVDGAPNLFLTSTGCPIHNPHRELNLLLKSVGMTPIDMCPTEHRKRIATEMDSDDVTVKAVCSMMDHSMTTHQQSYTFSSTVKRSIDNYITVNKVSLCQYTLMSYYIISYSFHHHNHYQL